MVQEFKFLYDYIQLRCGSCKYYYCLYLDTCNQHFVYEKVSIKPKVFEIRMKQIQPVLTDNKLYLSLKK